MRRRNRQCKRFAAKPVHDNIHWQPTQGSVQGAQDTLDKKAGNAMDTASLLIALLRASGIPARYVYGSVEVPAEQMMNWVGGAKTIDAAQQVLGQGGIPNVALVSGGKISAVRIEHTWVEALIQYQPGRGAKHVPGQSVPDTWVPMDGSFKVCVRRTHLESRAVIEDRPHEGDRGDDGTIDRWRAPAAARVQRRFQGVGSGTNP